MSRAHLQYWPKLLPHDLTGPATNLFYNAEVSAARYPHKPYLIFFDAPLTYAAFKRQSEQLAGFLPQACGVAKGDRVLLVMQNSPQFIINASGHKVWPAEVEAPMYEHPAIQKVCVVAAKDSHRGETVKALVVLRAAFKGKTGDSDIIEWTRKNMAIYKHPRIVEFVDALPKSATGKLQWRSLQEAEMART